MTFSVPARGHEGIDPRDGRAGHFVSTGGSRVRFAKSSALGQKASGVKDRQQWVRFFEHRPARVRLEISEIAREKGGAFKRREIVFDVVNYMPGSFGRIAKGKDRLV
jgi:hypothetical protein